LAKAFNDLAGVAFACFLLLLSGFIGFIIWGTLKTGVLPRWYGLSGIPIALLSLHASAGALFTEPRWLAGGGLYSANVTGLFFLWCGALAVIFLRMPEKF
jgi:hypothetical protein